MAERITIQLQDEGMLILPPELWTRLGLKAGDLMDVSELNGTIILSPHHAKDQAVPGPIVEDPQFQRKLKSIQDMLENL